jgi:hypothetical protein
LVPIVRQQHQGGIDDVPASGPRQEFAGGSTQRVAQRAHLDAGESPSEQRLSRSEPSPDLANDPTMRDRHASREERRLEATPHRPVAALERDERPAI